MMLAFAAAEAALRQFSKSRRKVAISCWPQA
jgi:hypothetical protein